MFRILVVDNEPYVVDWVSALIEEGIQRDIDVCRAYTAAEALDWLSRSRIDIVISDICMPRMDGLELAEQVKKRWPFAKVILITAHAQFDYAVTAIRNNVVSYILKTKGDDVIIGEVKRVMALVDQELNQAVPQKNMIEIQTALPELRNSFFRELLIQGEEDEDRIRIQFEALKVSMDVNTPVRLILCVIREWETVENLVLRQQSVQKMIEWMNSYVGDCGTLYPVDLGGCRMAWLLKEEPDSEKQQKTVLIQGRLEMLQDACAAGGGEHVSFSLYSKPVSVGNIREAYRSLDFLMNRMTREKETFVIFGGEEVGKWKVDTEGISRRMGLLLEEEKYDDFLNALSYYQALFKEHRVATGDCYNIYYSIALLINLYLGKREINKTEQIAGLEAKLFYPPKDGQWEDKFENLSELAGLIFGAESEMKDKISRNTVDVVKKYVLEHISEDISLTRLSEVTGYNTCYLSRIFKAQTGETLTEYVGREKMERVRTLMRDKNLNINDVAERSGFVSRTYFNRFIRKHTGKSPKDYKMSLEAE